MWSSLRWLVVLVVGASSAGIQRRTFFRRAHRRAGTNAGMHDFTQKPWVLVITVPDRTPNVERMQRLGGWLSDNDYRYNAVPGPDMDKYCPDDISNYAQNKAAGLRLLRAEWRGRTPDLSTYDLALFQMATLVGHLRAWQLIVDHEMPAVILEDDAEVTSSELLQDVVNTNKAQGADAILLDFRHCVSSRPPHLMDQAPGLVGYWVDVKAAKALLEKFPLNAPVDWGVNKVFNSDVNAVCPVSYPVGEYGGPRRARENSAAHGCKPMNDGGFLQDVHPVASMLAGLLSFD